MNYSGLVMSVNFLRSCVAVFILLLSVESMAGASCSGTRCLYAGVITKIYLSAGGSILVYMDKDYSDLVSGALGIGIDGVTHGEAVGVQMFIDGSDDEKEKALEFAKYFFNTALIAKTSGRSVEV